ncbi:MAG: SufD family Fe-S cluster assembly protein [Lachnospiraceae bacterium]|nr:SufD family Fe-S cluster assembly protein [Lachnospiraceae bacterium]
MSDKTMVLNSLPAKTWHWLKMNEIKVPIEESLYTQWESAAPVVIGAGENEELTKMIHLTVEEGVSEADVFRLEAAKGATLSVTFVISSAAEAKATAMIRTDIRAQEDATVHIYLVQLAGDQVRVISQITGEAAARAKVVLTDLQLGGELSVDGAQIDLQGKESDFTADYAYLGQQERVLDINYVVNHYGKKTTSRMKANGVLRDSAKKILRDTIDFKNGCIGAKASEVETVLLLGEKAINQSIPLILCQEEDVEGDHGATISRVDDRTLFYLMSRGISRNEAENIIARSMIDAVAEEIPQEKVRDLIRAYVKVAMPVEREKVELICDECDTKCLPD